MISIAPCECTSYSCDNPPPHCFHLVSSVESEGMIYVLGLLDPTKSQVNYLFNLGEDPEIFTIGISWDPGYTQGNPIHAVG